MTWMTARSLEQFANMDQKSAAARTERGRPSRTDERTLFGRLGRSIASLIYTTVLPGCFLLYGLHQANLVILCQAALISYIWDLTITISLMTKIITVHLMSFKTWTHWFLKIYHHQLQLTHQRVFRRSLQHIHTISQSQHFWQRYKTQFVKQILRLIISNGGMG